MNQETFTPYDPADALETKEDIAVFLSDALETGDAGYIVKALDVIARAKGMVQIARDAGLSRDELYRAFSPQENPALNTTLAAMDALGIPLTTRQAAA